MCKSSASVDRRIKRSKKALKEALIQLMKEKDFKEISITEIVREAEVNRGTFYKHYQYKEDLLEEIIDEVITDLIASYREPYKDWKILEIKNLTSSAVKVFDHVEKYANFYSLIFHANVLVGFQNRIGKILRDLALREFNEYVSNPKIDRELHASYRSYAILGMITEWVNSGFHYSSAYMAEQLVEIIKYSERDSVIKPNIKTN